MSLRIKKGTKVWGPKAPVARRPGAPPSAPSSARPSAERQSQTPIPVSTLPEPLPVLGEVQEAVEQQPSTQPPTTTHSHDVTLAEPPNINVAAGAEPASALKRKEGSGEKEPGSVPSKRLRVDEPPRPPTPPQATSELNNASSRAAEESTTLQLEPPTLEPRQDIESSVYPDPELSSGLGPAGSIPSGITGIPEAAGLGPAGEGLSSATQIALAPQIVQTAAHEVEQAQTEVSDGTIVSPIKKKKTVKRRKVRPADEGVEDATATLEMQLNAPRRGTGRRNRKKKENDGNKRGATPEGAENEQINPSTMKMAELCKDIRIGVKSSNHDMIKQRIIEQKAQAKLAKANLAIPPAEPTQTEGQNSISEEAQTAAIPSGPQMRIVNGQIVLAESSLHLDRHKRAEAENEVMIEVEENEFSHITTSGTYMKRERVQLWDSTATATFYKGLAQFGTNFEMIAMLLPGRSRRQIKLKFNSEERKNPTRINKVLMGEPEKIDLERFEEMSGLKLEEVEEIERERQAIAEEQEREIQAREKEKADADLRKKKEIADRSAAARRALASMGDETEGGSSGKENRVRVTGEDMAEAEAGFEHGTMHKGKGGKKAQPKPRKKKNPHGRGDGGDIVEVLGPVE
jgi:transcription factor TFIIIB component B''